MLMPPLLPVLGPRTFLAHPYYLPWAYFYKRQLYHQEYVGSSMLRRRQSWVRDPFDDGLFCGQSSDGRGNPIVYVGRNV